MHFVLRLLVLALLSWPSAPRAAAPYSSGIQLAGERGLEKRVIPASAAGAALNTDLQKGGGTDDTAALQAVLDKAQDGQPIKLVIDGPALVAGLEVYSNTTIDCLPRAGFFLKDEANRAVIRNAHRSREAITDHNIVISGCFINGNRFHQLGKPPNDNENQEPDGTWLAGLQLFGVRNVKLTHLKLWNIRAFGAWFANADKIRVNQVQIDNGSPRSPQLTTSQETLDFMSTYSNTDGIHINGPTHDVKIDGLVGHTGDDVLSLAAEDMSSADITVKNEMGPYVGQGPITDIEARNIVFDDAAYGLRLLSAQKRIDRVRIENVTGRVDNRAFIVSSWIIPGGGNVGSVVLRHFNLQATGKSVTAIIQQHIREHPDYRLSDADREEIAIGYPLFSLSGSIEELRLEQIVARVSDDRPIVRLAPRAAIVELSVDLRLQDSNCRSTPLRVEKGGSAVRVAWRMDWLGQKGQCRGLSSRDRR